MSLRLVFTGSATVFMMDLMMDLIFHHFMHLPLLLDAVYAGSSLLTAA